MGLDTHTAMELLCLAGAALSIVATLLEAFRDSLVFFCLWVLYLSLYQVESALKSVFRSTLVSLFLIWLVVVSGGAGLSVLPVVSVGNQPAAPSRSPVP